jgi:hypothetical protein
MNGKNEIAQFSLTNLAETYTIIDASLILLR